MLYRVYEQLVILARFRHLNGNLKLAGLGDGIDLWGCAMEAYNIGWIRAMGLIDGDVTRGRATGSGWWDSFVGARHGERDTGWIWAMGLIYGARIGAQDTGWIGRWDWFMGACHGGMRHWLDRGNGVDLWQCAALDGMGWWDWFMGACHGGTRHWLDLGDGIDLWGCAMGACSTGWIVAMGLIYGDASWGWATGSGWWHWLVGLRHGGARHWLDPGDGIDSWGLVMGPCDTGWIGAMGLIHRGTPLGLATLARPGWWDWFMGVLDTGWNGMMALIYGDSSWGRGTGSGKWEWFVGARHGVRCWLDVGDGIELWGRAMGACDWIGVMELICGGAPWGRMTLTRSGQWDWFMCARQGGARQWLDRGNGIDSWERAKWQSTIWLLNVNDDAMCPHVWHWGKGAECVWLRGW